MNYAFRCALFLIFVVFFFFNDTATTEIYTLSLHDALPIRAEDAPAHGLGGGRLEHRHQPGGHQRAERPDEHDEHERGPQLRRCQRVQEQREVERAERHGTPADQALRPEPVSDAGRHQAAEDAADGLHGQDQAVGGAVAVQDVADERGHQRPHDPLADAGDRDEQQQDAQRPDRPRDPRAATQSRQTARTVARPPGPAGAAGEAPAAARGGRISAIRPAATQNVAASASPSSRTPPSAATSPPQAAPRSRATSLVWPLRAFAVIRSLAGTRSGSSEASAGTKNCARQLSTRATR